VWLYYIMDQLTPEQRVIHRLLYDQYAIINENKELLDRDNAAIDMLTDRRKEGDGLMSLEAWMGKHNGVCPEDDDDQCIKQHWVKMHLAANSGTGYDNFRRLFKAIHKNKHDRDDNIHKKNYFTDIHYSGAPPISGATEGENFGFQRFSRSIIKNEGITRPGGGITPAEILLQIQTGLFNNGGQLLRNLQGEANLIKDNVLKAKAIEAEEMARPRDTSDPMGINGGGKRKKTKSTRKRKPTRKRKRKSTRKRKRKPTRKRKSTRKR
jgi:hypothetical protein